VSKSTPLVSAGIITTNTDKTIRSNPSDGTFAVPLAPGNYQVTVTADAQVSTFNIAVPDGAGAASIERERARVVGLCGSLHAACVERGQAHQHHGVGDWSAVVRVKHATAPAAVCIAERDDVDCGTHRFATGV